MSRKNFFYKKIFVGGGCGLAGSHIIESLLKSHPAVRIFSTYYKNTKPLIKDSRVRYSYADLTSICDCRKAAAGCDAAIMAAASTGGARFVREHTWEHAMQNLWMNLTMFGCFMSLGIRKIVYIGSATLYQPGKGKMRETALDWSADPPAAYYGFGWVGRYLEKVCQFIHEQTGVRVMIVRCANIYGPYAKFDPKTSNFIPALIRKAVAKEDPFEVWGSPTVARDVVYAEDFAEAIVKLLEYEGSDYEIFNVGSGIKTKVEQVVRSALKYAGHRPSRIVYAPRRPTTMQSLALDCSKAARLLKWRPRHTPEQGIRKTLAWWQKNCGTWKR